MQLVSFSSNRHEHWHWRPPPPQDRNAGKQVAQPANANAASCMLKGGTDCCSCVSETVIAA